MAQSGSLAQPSTKAVVGIILLVALAGIMAWRATAKPEPVRLGFVGTLSGYGSEVGVECRDGALLAVSDCNSDGGVDGRPVELVIRDDGHEAKRYPVMMEELTKLKVAGAVGPTCSTVTPQAGTEAAQRGVVLLSPTVSGDRDTPRNARIFTVYPSSSQVVQRITRHLSQRKLHRPAVIIDVRNSRPGVLPAIQKFVPLAGDTLSVITQYDSAASPSFKEMVTGVLETYPDCVLVFASAHDAALLCQQLRKAGSKLPVLYEETAATPALLAAGGSAVDGTYSFRTFDAELKSDRYRAFAERFERRFGYAPGFAAINGYDCARIILSTLSNGASGVKVRRKVDAISRYDGLQGPIGFGDNGEVQREMFLTTTRNGGFDRLE